MSMNDKPIPPRADIGAAIAYAKSAKTLIQTARDLRAAGAGQAEIDNVIDSAELQIDAMIASMPRDEGQQLALRARHARRIGR